MWRKTGEWEIVLKLYPYVTIIVEFDLQDSRLYNDTVDCLMLHATMW